MGRLTQVYFCLRFRLVCVCNFLLLSDPAANVSGFFMAMVALVVDDSMLIRYSVCSFLEQRGFTVESATNGAEAMEVLTRVRPALIVTDMQMPKMSGIELITALKSKPETAAVPIIILANKAGGEHADERANFTIYKDIDIDMQLAKALDAVLGKGSEPHAEK
jgi:CheY-like chemotaxis protein